MEGHSAKRTNAAGSAACAAGQGGGGAGWVGLGPAEVGGGRAKPQTGAPRTRAPPQGRRPGRCATSPAARATRSRRTRPGRRPRRPAGAAGAGPAQPPSCSARWGRRAAAVRGRGAGAPGGRARRLAALWIAQGSLLRLPRGVGAARGAGAQWKRCEARCPARLNGFALAGAGAKWIRSSSAALPTIHTPPDHSRPLSSAGRPSPGAPRRASLPPPPETPQPVAMPAGGSVAAAEPGGRAAAGAPPPPPAVPRSPPASPPHAPGAAGLQEVCDATAPFAARQLSYLQNIDFAAGAALPLRLPSGGAAGVPGGGGLGGGALGSGGAPSRAFLEAGTTLGQEAKRRVGVAGCGAPPTGVPARDWAATTTAPAAPARLTLAPVHRRRLLKLAGPLFIEVRRRRGGGAGARGGGRRRARAEPRLPLPPTPDTPHPQKTGDHQHRYAARRHHHHLPPRRWPRGAVIAGAGAGGGRGSGAGGAWGFGGGGSG
jgi:hypothetical protein